MNIFTIEQLEQQGVLNLVRGQIMKSDGDIAERAPILRPSDVVHNRAPEWQSTLFHEPVHLDFPTARIGDIAVCLHFLPGSTRLITDLFDGSIPTKGIALLSIKGNQHIDHDYLKVWLLSGVLQTELKRLQIGSHMATVKMSDLKQVRVPIPDISTQKQLIKEVVNVRESLELLSKLARQSVQLLVLQNSLFLAELNRLTHQ